MVIQVLRVSPHFVAIRGHEFEYLCQKEGDFVSVQNCYNRDMKDDEDTLMLIRTREAHDTEDVAPVAEHVGDG